MGFLLTPLIGIALNGGALYFLTLIVEEITYTGGIKFFVIGGVILGLINFFVKPLIKILSLPFMLISGIFVSIVINVGLLWFLSYFLTVAEFRDITLTFPNWSSYVIGAIVFGVINSAVHLFVK